MLTNSDDEDDNLIPHSEPLYTTTLPNTILNDQTPRKYPLSVTFVDDVTESELILTEELTESQRNYTRFAQMLPYNTDDPEIQQRQETLLSLLFTNNICTDLNFKIFIAEPEKHESEASKILQELFVLDIQDDVMDISVEHDGGFTNVLDDVPMSPASQISTMTLGLALDSPSTTKSVVPEPAAAVTDDFNQTKKIFPIFQKSNAFNATDPAAKVLESRPTKEIKWKPIGDKQYQIDAGQKKFGGTMCSCGFFYSVHEPEDEALHQKYHDIYAQLGFKVNRILSLVLI